MDCRVKNQGNTQFVQFDALNRDGHYSHVQRKRRLYQVGFFVLFILAPVFDIFRIDLTLGHLILFGQDWTLGLAAWQSGELSTAQATWNLIWRGLIPLALIVTVFAYTSWKYGRLYCGWLCPHFSVVETINNLMRRASGKFSIWDKTRSDELRPDGRYIPTRRNLWPLVWLAAIGFAFLWAVVFLTYLLPPAQVYSHLVSFELTRNETIFLSAATIVLSIEFLFARHLFCRFACAVGVFQSFVWMANKKAMVVGFDRSRAADCRTCNAACEQACPMRLKPRDIKRHMFTCTECAQCLEACEQVQAGGPGNSGKIQTPLLQWIQDECAKDTSERDFGIKPNVPGDCYRR
ncbi:4Fe-4S binding protein [Thiohalophilus thiocyanatoxydans]|uniref:4Fe-4S binding protein n=1 Tax=Thiohalophilus thiocyanatoxydans TaxID=381308 RepID=A0A4R8IPU1_9GAMM|nr:4Fe-4S binding protein [Thiohalophilus thiocyanatoxydans]